LNIIATSTGVRRAHVRGRKCTSSTTRVHAQLSPTFRDKNAERRELNDKFAREQLCRSAGCGGHGRYWVSHYRLVMRPAPVMLGYDPKTSSIQPSKLGLFAVRLGWLAAGACRTI
jgi:hypothetical protein